MATQPLNIKVDVDKLVEKLTETFSEDISMHLESELVIGVGETRELLQELVDAWGVERFRSLGRDDLKVHLLMQKHIPTY